MKVVIGYFVAILILTAGQSFAAKGFTSLKVPLEPIAEIKFDADGNDLSYPSTVFYDPVEEEIYLINAGTGQIVVYGPDFFPRISIGEGRGVSVPRGGTVLPNGDVYVCQVTNFKNPSPRLTVLNAAFFPELEIFLNEIPEAENFRPRQVAVSREGYIYLAGDNERGILVLDDEGNFLRRLAPEDLISSRKLAMEDEREKAGELTESLQDENKESPPEEQKEEDPFAHIPEEFRPRNAQQDSEDLMGEVLAPVKVNYVTIDNKGRIYLISAETGKIYVHGPDESLLFSFGTKGGSPGQLSQPVALAVDEKREILYVVDYMRHGVLVYNLEGDYLFEFGGRGTSPGWFNFPNGIVLNSQQHVIISDLYNKRVQVLDVAYEDVLPYLSDDPSGFVTEEFDTDLEQFAEEIREGMAEEETTDPEEISTEEGPEEENPGEDGKSDADANPDSEEPPLDVFEEEKNSSQAPATEIEIEIEEVIFEDDEVPTYPEAQPEQSEDPALPGAEK